MGYFDIATRAQAVVLRALDVPLEIVAQITDITTRQVINICQKAIARGWESTKPLFNNHLTDGVKKGRSIRATEDVEWQILRIVTRDRYGREKSCATISQEVGVSPRTVLTILKKYGYSYSKPTRKPGLTAKMKEERYQFALRYQYWTLEDWKAVIWSDETSVMLGIRRGNNRFWRRASEAFTRTTIRERWKGFSEFMFWGCFSYDFKGPCYVWKAQSTTEGKEAEKTLNGWNTAIELEIKAEWEKQQEKRREAYLLRYGRRMGGRPAQWRFTVDKGAFIRTTGSGIDWWRYLTCILIPLLIPFGQALTALNPDTLIQEDKAPSHTAEHHQVYFDAAYVRVVLYSYSTNYTLT